MEEWIVRAGVADPARLIAGYGRHQGYPNQQIYGFSVQYNPGSSIEELAKVGQFPNKSISYAPKQDLEAAVRPLNYSILLQRTKGIGFHHTLISSL